jgi:hypothetical protein
MCIIITVTMVILLRDLRLCGIIFVTLFTALHFPVVLDGQRTSLSYIPESCCVKVSDKKYIFGLLFSTVTVSSHMICKSIKIYSTPLNFTFYFV